MFHERVPFPWTYEHILQLLTSMYQKDVRSIKVRPWRHQIYSI